MTPPLETVDFPALELLPYGVIVTDAEGKILFYNEQEEKLSGRRKADVLGKNFFADVAPCTRVEAFEGRFEETMRGVHETSKFHFLFPFPNNPREVEINFTRFEHGGKPLCLISVHDITEAQRVHERMLLAERFREIGEVTATVTHNFNNVLAAIQGFSELIALEAEGQADLLDLNQSIQDASADGLAMVERILGLVRAQRTPPARTRVDLSRVAEESVSLCQARRGHLEATLEAPIALGFIAPEAPLHVQALAGELREVCTNLIRNALDAVSAREERRGRPRVDVRVYAEEGWCCVNVTDNGVGMDETTRRRLFDPLFTTKGEAGTGLGLSSCFAIINRHGGAIDVHTRQGLGSSFIVRLPPSPAPSPRP